MLDKTQASLNSNVIKLKFECGKKDEKQLTIFHSICLVGIQKRGGVLKMLLSYNTLWLHGGYVGTNIVKFEKRFRLGSMPLDF